MQRYFFKISYDGAPFAGWQRQDNAMTVQQCIEDAMSKLSHTDITITGCGRTDAGVHASDYYFHVDLETEMEAMNGMVYKLNKMLPSEISISEVLQVHNEAHARFDATSRSYIYNVHFEKDAFLGQYSHFYKYGPKPDFELLNQAADILMQYQSFYSFCKSHSDVNNYDCRLTESKWVKISENRWAYHVSANRFLRGMVRLIVGMCFNVARGKLTLEDVHEALEKQTRLNPALSVPPEGLALVQINYPYIK